MPLTLPQTSTTPPRPELPQVRRCAFGCFDCDYVASGQSARAVDAAYADHVAYVNAQLDPATDPHFEAQRLTALVIR